MANRILKEEGWQKRVRDKMGIPDSYLPDSVIEQPDIIDVAESNIIEQVPGYASLTGDKKTYLEAATVCECAILLCPGMPARLPKLSQGPHARYELGIDWEKKKAELQGERDAFLGKILSVPTRMHFGLSR
jgi:hypothetical protein